MAVLAAKQHGIVTRAQLVGAGMTAATIDARVRSQRLRPLHRGVYVLGALHGSLIPRLHREMAAVLACGPTAVLSHESAAALWELIASGGDEEAIHVTVPRIDRRQTGIAVHRVAALPAEDRCERDGVPVTTPVRTLLDLADRLRLRALEQALGRGMRLGHLDRAELRIRVQDGGGRRGIRLLRSLVSAEADPAMTRSHAEERLLALVRRSRLPPPEVNATIAGIEVDFFWRAHGVVVEMDGFAYHSSREAFEWDRERDAHLAARGIQVVRITWRQVTREPEAVAARVAGTLARSETRRPVRRPRRTSPVK